MKNAILLGVRARRVSAAIVLAIAATCIFSQLATATAWNGIEPLKSRRADVERILGKPIADKPGQNGTLQFNVAGGVVTIAFIDARFVAAKKLQPELEGTVRQVVLQHTNSSDTPESLNIASNDRFERQDGTGGVSIFRNLKDGIAYTFVNSKLKHTYFTPSQEEWARAQK
ncbi:MAG TPA: hypothetical protein VJS44_08810 [Pyrinomonadaceae bacterium]|nr:hypothetical protein [Pyrinomonadaceae bacterium]